MPFSKNLPYVKLLNPVTGELIRDDEIIHLVSGLTNDYKNTKFILSCYSGVTACMMFLALEKIVRTIIYFRELVIRLCMMGHGQNMA